MGRRDAWVLAAVIAVLAGMAGYRLLFIEPRAWGAACAAAASPLACVPRAGLLWLQQHGGFGTASLVLGMWGFLGGGFGVRVAAVAVGGIGVENYNATWGMIGTALGVWSWLEAAWRGRPAALGVGE